MMNELYDLCESLRKDIRNLSQKGDISPTELERAYKAVDIIKDIKTIEAMEGYYDDGYSGARYYYNDDMRYARRGNDVSYRRGMSRDSGHEDKEEMMRQIEEMKRKIENM